MILHPGSTTGVRRVWLAAAIALCVASPVFAQTTPATAAAPSLGSPSNASVAQIRTFIDANLTLLSGTDVEAAAARQSLVAPLSTPNLPPAFLDIYAQNLADQAGRTLGNMSQVGRLNLAIVTWRLAGASESIRLAPLITSLLNDESPAVVLWAAKAGAPLLPAVVNAGNAGVLKAVDGALTKFPNEIAVVTELYDALSYRLADQQWVSSAAPALLQAAAPQIVQTMQTSLGRRLPNGDVLFESRGLPLVLDWRLFPLLPAAQQTTSLKLVIQGMNRASEMAAVANDPNQKRELIKLLNRNGASVLVIATASNKPNSAKAAEGVRNLNVIAGPEQVNAAVQALVNAIHADWPASK